MSKPLPPDSTEVAQRDEHDDDLSSVVDVGDEMETDDFPKTSEDFEADSEEAGRERGDRDDDNIVGK